MFEKLHKYIGKSVEALVNRPDQPHVFRLHKKARPRAPPRQRACHAAGAAAGRCRPRVGAASQRQPSGAALVAADSAGSQRVYYVREDIMKRAISVRARWTAPGRQEALSAARAGGARELDSAGHLHWQVHPQQQVHSDYRSPGRAGAARQVQGAHLGLGLLSVSAPGCEHYFSLQTDAATRCGSIFNSLADGRGRFTLPPTPCALAHLLLRSG